MRVKEAPAAKLRSDGKLGISMRFKGGPARGETHSIHFLRHPERPAEVLRYPASGGEALYMISPKDRGLYVFVKRVKMKA